MTTNVFLVPCDPGNFDRTVLSTVEPSDYPDSPEALADREGVRFWGARAGESNEGYFEKMEQGDLVLFYQDGNYIGVGFVGKTFVDENAWASETFWNSAPSTLIYTVEEFTPVSVPRRAVNRIFDYTADYYPQGLSRVADERINRHPLVVMRAVEKYDENQT